MGENPTSKGTFIYDQTSASCIQEEDAKWNNDYCLDYEHQQVQPGLKGPIIAAGWFRLAFKPDGLYAVNVRYTEEAKSLILSKSYRYTSPTFTTDQNGVITSLFNVSLVNIPATDNQVALIAASKQKTGANPNMMSIELPDEVVSAIVAIGVADTDVPKWILDVVNAELTEEQVEPTPPTPPATEVASSDVVKTSKVEYLTLLAAKDRVESLSAELTELRSKMEAKDRAEVMGRLKANGKITPSMTTFITTLSTAQLQEFEKSVPTILAREPVKTPEVAETYRGMSLTQLVASDVMTRIQLKLENPDLYEKVEKLRSQSK